MDYGKHRSNIHEQLSTWFDVQNEAFSWGGTACLIFWSLASVGSARAFLKITCSSFETLYINEYHHY